MQNTVYLCVNVSFVCMHSTVITTVTVQYDCVHECIVCVHEFIVRYDCL